tara:strand:- start:2682 stop:4370 length:1689 start_codon:yes stop_codon:yes gene_type:complete
MKLLQHFKELTVRPKNAQELKGLILQLAIQGKLTSKWRKENPDIEPASELFKQINAKKLPTKISADNIPYKIPESWNWYNLVDLGSINGGFAFKSGNYIEEGVRVIRISDFDENGFKNHKIVRHEYSDALESYVLEDKNILIAMTGGTVGKSLFVDKVPEVMVVNQRVATIKIYKPIYEAYVNCVIPTKLIQDVIEEAKNSTNDNISMSNIKGFKIPLPPLEEQKEIVNVVAALFKEVEQLEQLTVERITLKEDFVTSALHQLTTNNANQEWAFLQEHFKSFFDETSNIKKLRETVLQLAVQGKLTRSWRESHPELVSGSHHASEILKRIQKEKAQLIKDKKIKKEKALPPITKEDIPYELPEGWVWCRLNEILHSSFYGPRFGKEEYVENGVPTIRTTDMDSKGYIKLKNPPTIKLTEEKLKLYKLEKGDLLVTRTGSIGTMAIFNEEYDAIPSAYLIRFRFLIVNIEYVFNLMHSPYGQKSLGLLTNTVAQPNINATSIRDISFPLPPLEEQKAIVEKVNALMGLCDTLEQEVQQSQEHSEMLMQSCLREVFEGKKEVCV